MPALAVSAAPRWRRNSRRPAAIAAMLAVPWLLISTVEADSVTYAYDALGRVIQATDATIGQAVRYDYDAVGNITAQQSLSVSTPAISGLSIGEGVTGTQMTISGTGFSTVAGNNIVKFNGITATVVSATQTQLTVVVPTGATTGIVTVQIGSSTVGSSHPFTVEPTQSLPVITSFLPTLGASSTSVTVTGSNFIPAIVSDKVQFGGGAWVSPATATATTLATTVPSKVWSGKIKVSTEYGIGTSSGDFFTPPSGYGVGTIGSTGRMSIGTATPISLPTAGYSSLQIFDANAGALLTVGTSSMAITGATIKVFAPDGSLLASGIVTANNQGIQLPRLTLSGIYAIVVDPGSYTGSLALTILTPLTGGTLTVGGSSLPLTLSPTGQRAFVTFNGTAGQYLTLVTAGQSFTGTITVTNSAGVQLTSASVTSTTAGIQLPLLSATDLYTILVDPGNASSSMTLSLITPVTGTANGNDYQLDLSNPAARGLITFTGTPGQYVTLAVWARSSQGHNNITGFQVTVYAPDGTLLNGTALMTPPSSSPQYTPFVCNLGISGCYGNTIINLGPIPSYTAGTTFTALVAQTGGSGGAIFYHVTNPLTTSNLTVNGGSITRYVPYAGQSLMVPIDISSGLLSGQGYTLTISETNSNIPSVQATILGARGQILPGPDMSATCSNSCNYNNYSGSASVAVSPQSTDAYTIFIQQIPQTTGTDEYGPLYGGITVTMTSP